MRAVLIAAAHKSSGKTTLAVGITGALHRKGHQVQSFKKGPDYIDPMWLSLASRGSCYNLDFHTMDAEAIREMFSLRSRVADRVIVEGNKGLFDGIDVEGSDSNAALASLLDLPVVLVIDAVGMTRGIAPLILGYSKFGAELDIVGVILNKVGGIRHEQKLRRSLEYYTDVPVLGAVGFDKTIGIKERHLGLMPTNELPSAQQKIKKLAQLASSCIDFDKMFPRDRTSTASPSISARGITKDVRIAVATDAAFGFYYPDDLEALELAGAQIVPFSAIEEKELPDADGLFIGVGFPEECGELLSANKALRMEIRGRLESGFPAYAECGGLMYLCRSIVWNSDYFEMVGFFPADAVMNENPVGRGYVHLRETGLSPWPGTAKGQEIFAHEFHYASLKGIPDSTQYAYDVIRGYGIDGKRDGVVLENLVANFAHQRNIGNNLWAERFVEFVRSVKRQKINYFN